MKLLLVEDEPYTREGILSAVDWDALEITKVLAAEDGQRGLEIALQCAPDIVLADMRMPKMDGADMAKSIKEVLPGCVFIFMSGYSDIGYYKSALQVSALDYVSKPLDIDELVKALQKGIGQVKANREKEEYLSTSRSDGLAVALIADRPDTERLMQLWNDWAMPWGEKYALHTLILKRERADGVRRHINQPAGTLGIEVCVGEVMASYVIHAAIPRKNTALLHRFARGLLSQPGSDRAYLAIGDAVSHPTQLHKSYESACGLIKLSFYHPQKRLFVYGDPAPSLANGYDQIDEFNQLLLRTPEKARMWTENQFEKIRQHAGTPIELVKYWGYRMCTELYFQMDRIKKSDIGSIPIDEKELWNKISAFGTLDELKDFVLEVIDKLDTFCRSGADLPVVQKVQRYIYNNFSAPLTLEAISDRVNISVTHLCSIFKEATGQTINQYILDVRMHRAKLMLESTHMHIHEIARAAGYSSSSYFIKAFRKSVGVTPQEYRKECRVYEEEA
ncbi:MAG: response regulator [Eubacteriales bacterium]|nr:response regulator [Eubacteriales bacterium]